MKSCSIPLFSGIGNTIQSLPFILKMKKQFDRVTAHCTELDFKETPTLFNGIFDEIYPHRKEVPSDHKVFRPAIRRSFPEYKGWFIDNGMELPDDYNIDHINYNKSDIKHKVIIWPECKLNWVCKLWPYFTELANHFDDVGIVGLYDDPVFSHGTDYRGKFSLLDTGGIIKNADIFIGNDGGLTHYAAALGIKTFIIFGASDPIKNMPPNNGIRIFKNMSCQPCQFVCMRVAKGNQVIGCSHRKCLNTLTVEEVLKVINDNTNNDSV